MTLLLFYSDDQGRNWHQIDKVGPEAQNFVFRAPADGLYYFRSAAINLQDKQDPENIFEGPPQQKILIDTRKPEQENWREIIPEAKDTLEAANLVADHFIADYLQDAKTAVKVYTMDGKHVRDVQLPGIGTASGFGGKRKDTETFYSFSSFTTPPGG